MFCFQGGFEYKKAIVESVITIIEENPEAKEAGLFSLRGYLWNVCNSLNYVTSDWVKLFSLRNWSEITFVVVIRYSYLRLL